MNDKVIMTAEEEDKNAGVTRDINGNVISEATDNNKLYNLELIKREYHSVTSEFTYQIPIDDILEEFDNVETFKKAANQKYNDFGYDENLEWKFIEFINNYDYDREDDWVSDRKGGCDVDFEIKE
jgi:hypothetical protein